jgi:hypothetical protein
MVRDDRHNRRNFAAEKFMRTSQLSIAEQAKALQTIFPESRVKLGRNALEWEGTLQPSPHSKVYTIHIKYVYSLFMLDTDKYLIALIKYDLFFRQLIKNEGTLL